MTTNDTIERRSERRAHFLVGLEWHIGAFVIINVFFWLMDVGLGQEGVQWAHWIAVPWALALAFHALAYSIDGRQTKARKTQEFLRKEQNESRRPS